MASSTRRVQRRRAGFPAPPRFSAFYLNRCNRSGIIMNGGPIGGVKQTGKWKLDARFNKAELRRRCEKVAEYRERIHVSGDDGSSSSKGLIRRPLSSSLTHHTSRRGRRFTSTPWMRLPRGARGTTEGHVGCSLGADL